MTSELLRELRELKRELAELKSDRGYSGRGESSRSGGRGETSRVSVTKSKGGKDKTITKELVIDEDGKTKILNPETDRYVDANGTVGRKIRSGKQMYTNPKFTPPSTGEWERLLGLAAPKTRAAPGAAGSRSSQSHSGGRGADVLVNRKNVAIDSDDFAKFYTLNPAAAVAAARVGSRAAQSVANDLAEHADEIGLKVSIPSVTLRKGKEVLGSKWVNVGSAAYIAALLGSNADEVRNAVAVDADEKSRIAAVNKQERSNSAGGQKAISDIQVPGPTRTTQGNPRLVKFGGPTMIEDIRAHPNRRNGYVNAYRAAAEDYGISEGRIAQDISELDRRVRGERTPSPAARRGTSRRAATPPRAASPVDETTPVGSASRSGSAGRAASPPRAAARPTGRTMPTRRAPAGV